MEYGLIGAKLGHSYSKIIHEAVCGYSYELHPLPLSLIHIFIIEVSKGEVPFPNTKRR